MKKFKRFKQSYRDVVNSIVDDWCYPSSSPKVKKSVARAMGLGNAYIWLNKTP